MKIVLWVSICVASLALVGAAVAPAQEVAPDENLLNMACDVARDAAIDEGFQFGYCRRAKPDEISGNRAKIHVDVTLHEFSSKPQKYRLEFRFQRSLWSLQTWTVV